MADIFEELVGEQRSLSEELFARSDDLKLFISSKMRGGVFTIERQGCAEALEGTGMARAWYWERATLMPVRTATFTSVSVTPQLLTGSSSCSATS